MFLILDINITREDIIKDEELRLKPVLDSKTYYSHVPTEYQFDLPSDHQRMNEKFTVSNMKKYQVFRDLYRKENYVTNAEPFGGDFLTYNADPFSVHATQIIHVIEKNEQFDPIYLLSCARLSVSVKKKCVFAYVNDDDSVTYQTVEWDNPKLKEIYALNDEKDSVMES
jgi:tRNA splicing endonuclease